MHEHVLCGPFPPAGAGSTSSCHRCVRKGDSAQYACKVIDKRQVEVNFSGLLEQFHVEVKVG